MTENKSNITKKALLKDGWGWFLFAGLLILSGFSYGDNNKNKKEVKP